MSNQAKTVQVALADSTKADGIEVQTTESTERWSDFTLDDGTELRIKMIIAAFIRLNDRYDQEGNPVYAVKGAPQVYIKSASDQYKQKGS